MGLLSRASNLDENSIIPGLAFSDFITKHSLKVCAMLEKNNTNYCIKHSIGFDALSILSASSTIDFWEGICKNTSQIYSFSGLKLAPLLQLFSENLKYDIKELYVYKNTSSQILISLNEVTNDIAADFENINEELHSVNIQQLNPQIKENSFILKFMLNFSEAIESFLSANEKHSSFNFEEIEKVISNEIYNRFVCYYNSPDATIADGKNALKSIFITGKAFSVELIVNHLIINLKEVLGNYAELIKIDYCGTADSCEQVKSFLQVA